MFIKIVHSYETDSQQFLILKMLFDAICSKNKYKNEMDKK